jgi:hypothetical protein
VGPGGGRPAKSPGRPARFYVDLAHGFGHTCLHEKGKAMAVEKVGRGQTTWPARGHKIVFDDDISIYTLEELESLQV